MAVSQAVELVEQQTQKEEQEELLHNSKHPSMNRQFSLWEVVEDSIRLPRVQSTYFIVFLAMSIIPLIAIGVGNHAHYKQRLMTTPEQIEQQSLCESTVLNPWFESFVNGTNSKTENEKYRAQFEELCSSTYKSPAEMTGEYTFTNGTFTFDNSTGFVKIDSRWDQVVTFSIGTVFFLWNLWAKVVVACGLVIAAAATTRSSRDVVQDISITCGPPAHKYTAKITSQIRAQFSMTVLEGITRLFFTLWAQVALSMSWDFLLMEAINVFNWTQYSTPYRTIFTVWTSDVMEISKYWAMVNPFQVFLFLAYPMAALEIGVWGFTALYRSFKLTRGNRWKAVLLWELLMLLENLSFDANTYISGKLVNTSTGSVSSELTKTPVSEVRYVANVLINWFLLLVWTLPGCFVVPVFYIKCKAFVQKQASIA